MPSFVGKSVRRPSSPIRRSVRPRLEHLEDRNLLSSDVTFNFTVPANGAYPGGQAIYFYVLGNNQTEYLDSSTDQWTSAANGVSPFAQVSTSSGTSTPLSISLPSGTYLSGRILMTVGPVTITSGESLIPSNLPNNVYDFVEFTYGNSGGTDYINTDSSQVDQVGLTYTLTTTGYSSLAANAPITSTTVGTAPPVGSATPLSDTTLQSDYSSYITNSPSPAAAFNVLLQSPPSSVPRVVSPTQYLQYFDPFDTALAYYFEPEIKNFFSKYTSANSFTLDYPGDGTFTGGTQTLVVAPYNSIASATATSGVVTITTTQSFFDANTFATNDWVSITGLGHGYDGYFQITGSNSANHTFTYNDANTTAPSVTGSSTAIAQDMTYHPASGGNSYTVLQLTSTNYPGQVFYIYEPFFSSNDGSHALPSAPPAPGWLVSAGKSTESSGEMVFAQDGVFASGGLDPTAASGPLNDLENAIGTAFNRGIATSTAPDDWVNPTTLLSAIPGNQGAVNNSLSSNTPYYYVITAVNSVGETVASNEVTVTTSRDANPSVTLNWIPQSNTSSLGVLGVSSYNIYRGTSSGQEQYIGSISNSNGQTASFLDSGSPPISPPPNPNPPTYYPNSHYSSNWETDYYNYYASFLHQPSIMTGGYAYALPHDDQGNRSTDVTVFSNSTNTYTMTSDITLAPWTSSPSASPSTSSSFLTGSLPANVALLFLTEDRFAWTVDSVLSLVTKDPNLTTLGDRVMSLLDNMLHVDNPALGTGLGGLRSAISSNPYSGSPFGLLAQAMGLEMAANMFSQQNQS